MSDDQVLSASSDIAATYAAQGYKNGTTLQAAANTVYKAAFENMNDQPFNTSDRGFMIDAVALAQQKLAEQGIDTSIADIQAILWYYEKRLYAETGARATPDVSYEEVARRVVEEQSRDGGPAGSEDLGQDVVPGPDGAGFEASGGEVIGEERALYQSRELNQERMRVFHGGPDTVTEPRVLEDQDGLPPGFSVARERETASFYANLRDGDAISEFDIDMSRYSPIGEMEAYEIWEQVEVERGLDVALRMARRSSSSSRRQT